MLCPSSTVDSRKSGSSECRPLTEPLRKSAPNPRHSSMARRIRNRSWKVRYSSPLVLKIPQSRFRMSSRVPLNSSNPSAGARPNASRTSMARSVDLRVAICCAKLGSAMEPPLLSIGVHRGVEVAAQFALAADNRAPGDLLAFAGALGSDLHSFRRNSDRVEFAVELQLALDRLVEFGGHAMSPG